MKLRGVNKVFSNRWIQVYEKVYDSNGKTLKYYQVGKDQKVAAILAIDTKNQVILVEQYRPAIEAMTIDLPGGGVEVTETPLSAAKRELLEETGYTSNSWRLLCKRFLDSGQKDCVQYIYIAEGAFLAKNHTSIELKVIIQPLDNLLKTYFNSADVLESSLGVALAAYGRKR